MIKAYCLHEIELLGTQGEMSFKKDLIKEVMGVRYKVEMLVVPS